MKVEVLYVTDCPSHPPAVRLLKDVLAAEGIKAGNHRGARSGCTNGKRTQVPRLSDYPNQRDRYCRRVIGHRYVCVPSISGLTSDWCSSD
jgi:hypothetical protein